MEYVEIDNPITAEAEVHTFTLVSDDIYVRRYDASTVPLWYQNLVETLVQNSPYANQVNTLLDNLTNVSDGYAVELANLRTADSSTLSLLSTLQTTVDGHTATIGDITTTYATKTEASAIAATAIQSYINGGSANAWFTGQISTYASQTMANSTALTSLGAVLDGQQVSINTVESIALNAQGWAANASKLITDVDGNITGWSFGDGTNIKSNFTIHADNFTVASSTTNHIPFTIVGSDISFNGKVSFTNVTDTPTINHTFIQTTAPTTGMIAGDTWIDTDDSNKVYSYNGSSWVSIVEVGNKTFLQTAAPTSGMITGDIWIDTDDNYKQYRWNGSSWVAIAYNPATAINAGTTTINGGKITTNTVEANRLKPATGSSTVWSGGSIVSQDFNGNDVGSIGTPTTGFRLSSDAAGTSTDPTIYGAYIKGGTMESTLLDSSTIKVRDLIVVTDAAFLTLAAFPFIPTSTNIGFYAYNSTIGDSQRLSRLSGDLVMFYGANTWNPTATTTIAMIGPIFATLSFNSQDVSQPSVELRMLLDGAVIATDTMGYYTGGYYATMKGLDYQSSQYTGTIKLAVRFNNVINSLSGTGVFTLQYRLVNNFNGAVVIDWTAATLPRGTVFNL